MQKGLDSLNPVTFEYEQDEDLLFNQNSYYTQQGLNLNLVNALSGCKDEVILNYSNVFLTKRLPINKVITLPSLQVPNLSLPTYLAIDAYPSITNSSRYITLSATSTIESPVTATASLSAPGDVYFGLQNIDGLTCRIYNIKDNTSRCLTVDMMGLSCVFTPETDTIFEKQTNVFEYTLDDSGYLKLYYRPNIQYYSPKFYKITFVNSCLSAVDVKVSPSTNNDIFKTNWSGQLETPLTNDFVYYDYLRLNNFLLNESKTVEDVEQNYVLYYNYQSSKNVKSEDKTYLDFFKGKNVLSESYYVNDKLQFKDTVIQRDYTNILSKQNSETFAGDLQLNYNYYTKDYLLKPDKTTKFTLPDTLYPYKVMNVINSGLIQAGAYGGASPLFSDKISKELNINNNVVLTNDANGTYLYTWLYTNSDATTAYWVDRYYYPQKTSIINAFTGNQNQIFTYNSPLCVYLAANYSAADFMYYDIRSSFVFEPSATYYYSRIGDKYISKITNSFPIALSAVPIYDNVNSLISVSNSITFDKNYSKYTLQPINGNNSFAVSFDFDTNNLSDVKSNLIIGNNFDEGISLYKGGSENIFTPGYIINSLTGVDVFNHLNEFLYSINISTYSNSNAKVLDIINIGFDHIIKLLYLNTDTNTPGFLDIDIRGSVYNKYEFVDLVNKFNVGKNILLFSKFYVGDSQIWYLVSNQSNQSYIYKFDYASNNYLGSITMPTGNNNLYSSFVLFNNSVSALTGYNGKIFNEKYGVSKLKNTVFFRNLSTGVEFPSLSAFGGSIFDIDVYKDKLYVLTNNNVICYDSRKFPVLTFTTSSNICSGVKLDFINENYETKLLSYGANLSGNLVVDKFNIDTAKLEETKDLGIKVQPEFFGEFNVPTIARMSTIMGIGNINGAFISGGIVNAYTLANPIVGSSPTIDINAVLAGSSTDCSTSSVLSASVTTYTNEPIPTDVTLDLYEDTIPIITQQANGVAKTLSVTYNNPQVSKVYSLVVSRTVGDNLVVNMQLNMLNGTFYTGSFRNAVIGSTVLDPNLVFPGFANALYAYNINSLIPQNSFLGLAQSYALSPTFNILPYTEYIPNTYINGSLTNPKSNFFLSPVTPNLAIVSNPNKTNSTYTSGFSASLLSFTSLTNPQYGNILSGGPMQAPVNFTNINKVNQFEDGNMVLRADLYSGTNYNNKQVEIVPFDVTNSCRLTISVDTLQGFINVYNNGILLESVTLSAGAFYSSYYLNNDFGVGMPVINNIAANIIKGLQDMDFSKNFSLNNITVYNKALNTDEAKMDYLKTQKIDAVNFSVPQGTRNNTDTLIDYNKMVIPGRKSNSVKLYIKNLSLSTQDRLKLNQIILDKLVGVLPINTNNVEIEYPNE